MSNHLRYCSLSLLLVIISTVAFAQGQNNNWLFGSANSVNFNSGSPVVSPFTEISNGGTASISNNAGTLLFNTNGATVYDVNQNAMPAGTGLQGINAVVVPDPASANVYYIFSVTGSDLIYSKVDMSLNGGLGDVTQKNVAVGTNISTFTVTRQRDGINFWVVCQYMPDPFTDGFRSYLVSAAGVGPAVSSPAITSAEGLSSGVIKVSDNGCFLVSTETGNFDFPRKQVCLYKFNNFSGDITNGAVVNTLSFPSSASFSPDNTKLYLGQAHIITFNGAAPVILQPILQYDLTAGTNAQILASPTPVSAPMTVYALQQAPDAKIYFTRLLDGPSATLAARTDDSHHTLGSIESPNVTGLASAVNESKLTSAAIYINGNLPPDYNLTYTGSLGFCSSVFAVQWRSFHAKEENKNALLNWAINNDDDIVSFDVQYSIEGNSFHKAGSLQALPNGLPGHSYSFADVQYGSYAADAVYYRIKGIAHNGTAIYSPVVVLKKAMGLAGVTAYPNPFSNELFVKLSGNEGNKISRLILYDLSGKLMISVAGEDNANARIKGLSPFAPGLYLLKTITEKGTFFTKLLKR